MYQKQKVDTKCSSSILPVLHDTAQLSRHRQAWRHRRRGSCGRHVATSSAWQGGRFLRRRRFCSKAFGGKGWFGLFLGRIIWKRNESYLLAFCLENKNWFLFSLVFWLQSFVFFVVCFLKETAFDGWNIHAFPGWHHKCIYRKQQNNTVESCCPHLVEAQYTAQSHP